MENCSFCSGEIQGEEKLSCGTCHKTLHFKCGTGLSDVGQRAITTYLKNCAFKCPLCSIGEKNTLIHKVITINQLYNEGKHAIDFDPGSAVTDADTSTTIADAPIVIQVPAVVTPVENAVNDTVNSQGTVDPANIVTGEATTDPVILHEHVTPVPVTSDEPSPLPPSLANESLTPLHEYDVSRSKKLAYVMRTLLRLPGHPNTIGLGDSHFTHMDGKDIDPDDDQVRIRSVGGLCIPAAVYALAHHKFVHRKIKNVIWNLGTNDALHRHQHCDDDRVKYLKLLYSESVRVFPKATINFVLPFIGLTGVSTPFIDELEKSIKSACPNMIVFRPPNMRNKVAKSGIHLSRSGRSAFVGFLRSKFVLKKQRVFSRDSGKRSRVSSTSQVTQRPYAEAHIPSVTGPTLQAAMGTGAPFQVPPLKLNDLGLVNDIATKVMELISQQNMLCRYYPPLPPWSVPPR